MVELIVEVLLELGLQIMGEFAVEAFGRARSSSRTFAVTAAVLGFATAGAVLGAVSVLVFPHHFIRNEAWRLVALAGGPALAGAIMTIVGRWRARRGDPVLRIDRFAYAFVFAFAMSLVRWVLAD